MRILTTAIATLATLGLMSGCRSAPASAGVPAPASEARAAEAASVRAFLLEVSGGVTRDGPSAWQRYFARRDEFFMASDGVLAFRDGTSALVGITAVARLIQRIELTWGDDLRIDVLSADFAVVGVSWSEVRLMADGTRIADHGYFTAVVEREDAAWRFRDVHWSQPLPGP